MRAALVTLVVCWCSVASAHQTSVKYVDLVAHEEGVEVTFKVAPGDVTEPMGLPADATPTAAEAAAKPAVEMYVLAWLGIRGCEDSSPRARVIDAKFIAVTWTCSWRGARRRDELSLDFTRFFATDTRHEAIVRLSAPGARAVQTIVRSSEPQVTLQIGRSPSLLAWVRTGMDHIYSGFDHILFVISLLLVVMLRRENAAWSLRALVPTLRSTGLVITAFTIAHSTTLIAAALGLVALPSRFVESMIALSIAYTAAEDVANPAVRWRFALTFGFGLVHGLGFAATLAELLPPTDVVVPLLCFNVGVEIGQLTIVVTVLPVLYLLARKIGADRYRRIALPALATAIFLLGIAMVVERVLGLRLLPM
jgi:hypothetical protein